MRPSSGDSDQVAPRHIDSSASQIFSAGVFAKSSRSGRHEVILKTGETLPVAQFVDVSSLENGQPVLVQAMKSEAGWEVPEIRPAPPQVEKRHESLFLWPLDRVSTWALACQLAQTPPEERWREAIGAARAEFVRRGRSAEDLEAMTNIAKWALNVMNPDQSTVHTVVADADDLEMAVEVSEKQQLDTIERLKEIRSSIERYR